jgi:type II secretory ATPase GspE/PulE/Tfp pilus assembly ATPase PilB-like protein
MAALSTRLKLLSNLNVLETRRPQDGHIDITAERYSLDVRLSITPTIWGESIVLRLLNRAGAPLDLDTLGFSAKHRARLDAILGVPSGLVLVTGPTGSGKTTTLAALLTELNRNAIKVISIEDPVEYRIAGVTQIQTNDELGLSFDAILRRVFRQDPDIIMVGEIRDRETAELAVRAALTGHLVFATLHTNNALEAVFRLANMGIPAYLAGAVLKAVVAQRLVRKICPACGGTGCNACAQTGCHGRTVIAETLCLDDELSGAICDEVSRTRLGALLAERGFTTLHDDADEKIATGITTAEEVRRELGAQP